MNLMQDLAPEIQCEIAVDIIMRASNMIDRDYTKLISEVSTYNPKDFKRWYDKNPNIHVAIESLKDLTDEQKEIIIKMSRCTFCIGSFLVINFLLFSHVG